MLQVDVLRPLRHNSKNTKGKKKSGIEFLIATQLRFSRQRDSRLTYRSIGPIRWRSPEPLKQWVLTGYKKAPSVSWGGRLPPQYLTDARTHTRPIGAVRGWGRGEGEERVGKEVQERVGGAGRRAEREWSCL